LKRRKRAKVVVKRRPRIRRGTSQNG